MPGRPASASRSTETWVTERNQIRGFLRGHDAREPGRGENIAFLGIAGEREIERCLLHQHIALRDGDAFGHGLAGDIDHMGFAGRGNMRKFAHSAFCTRC
jgi:hypothetical protein